MNKKMDKRLMQQYKKQAFALLRLFLLFIYALILYQSSIIEVFFTFQHFRCTFCFTYFLYYKIDSEDAQGTVLSRRPARYPYRVFPAISDVIFKHRDAAARPQRSRARRVQSANNGIQYNFGDCAPRAAAFALPLQYDIAEHPSAKIFLQCSTVAAVLACLTLSLRFWRLDQSYEHIINFSESLVGVIFKVVIILLSPYNFLEGVNLQIGKIQGGGIVDEIKLNHLLVIFAFFRNALFGGTLLACSYYMHPRATRIRRLFGVTSGAISVIKCIFKDAPAQFIAIIFSFSVVVFTFAFRVSQAEVYSSSSAGTVYSNMAWMTMITMTTLGFGDLTPQTIVGRVIGALCSTWGALIVSVMVVVLTSAFSLDQKESQALRIINKLNYQNELKQVAGEVLRETLSRLWKNRKEGLRNQPNLRERKLFSKFRVMRRVQKCMNEKGSEQQFYSEFCKRIQGATRNVACLSENNLKMVNLLTEQCIFKQQLAKNAQKTFLKVRIKQRKKC